MPSSLSSKLRLRAAWGPPHGRVIPNSVLVVLFILLTFGLSLVGAAGRLADAAGLKDIQGHWAASEITKAVASGYVKGYPDNTFKPNAGVTRAELVVMLNRALAVAPGQNARSFKDVGSKDWFMSDVKAALSAGYVNGYPDGTFRPQKSVNRQEAACPPGPVDETGRGYCSEIFRYGQDRRLGQAFCGTAGFPGDHGRLS